MSEVLRDLGKRKLNWVVLFFILIVLALVNREFFHSKIYVGMDDSILIPPLLKIHTFKEYVLAIKQVKIYDLQPLRDLTYFLDFNVMKTFNSYTIHVSNLLYYIAFLIALYQVLEQIIEAKVYRYAVLLIYAFTPINAWAVAWTSGRKHVLSALFIMLAWKYFYKFVQSENTGKTYGTFSVLLFLASCLSQPINVLWPCVPTAISLFNRDLFKKNTLYLSLLWLISFTILGCNYYYYNVIYPHGSGGFTKFAGEGIALGDSLLMLGRYFSLCFNPFSATPLAHSESSLQNIWGLVGGVLFCYWVFKRCFAQYRKEIFLGVSIFIFPLITVIFKKTNIFVSDTYMLVSQLGIYYLLVLILQTYQIRAKIVLAAMSIIIFGLLSYTKNFVPAYYNDHNMAAFSYNKEKTHLSIFLLLKEYIEKGDLKKSNALVEAFEVYDPFSPILGKLKCQVILLDRSTTPDQKIKKIDDIKKEYFAKLIFQVDLFKETHDKTRLYKTLNIITSNPSSFIIEYYDQLESTVAYVVNTIHSEKDYPNPEIKIQYVLEAVRKYPFWNEKVYTDELTHK
jgi:uncharacterized protein Veg